MQDFFLWCLLINTCIYIFTAIAVLVLRDLVCSMQMKMFGLDQAAARKSLQGYLANYKLLITVFNFTPWVAILIIK